MPASLCPSLGDRIRAERTRQGRSLRAVAREVGVSPSMMSQIETGKTQPSVATLFAITSSLRLPLHTFFEPSDMDSQAAAPLAAVHSGAPAFTAAVAFADGPRLGPHVPPGKRQLFAVNDRITIERLALTPPVSVEFIRATLAPGASSIDAGEPLRHPGWEYGFLLRGELVLTLDGEEIRLGPGDAVSFECGRPHGYRNDGTETAVGIWFLTR